MKTTSDENTRSWHVPTFMARVLSLAFALLLTLLMPVLSWARVAQNKPDILFIAYDQGESNAFRQIEKSLQNSALNYQILSLGRAAEIFSQDSKNYTPSPERQAEFKQERGMLLKESELQATLARFKPGIVYSGMASAAQAQLINAFKSSGSYTIAFYDNFDPVSQKDYVRPFLHHLNQVDELHTPSTATRESFNQLAEAHGARLRTVGQPALEAWDHIYDTVDPEPVKTHLGLKPGQSVILFAGGYDSTYESYFRTFLSATRKMPSVTFLVTFHPKTDGGLERRLIREMSLSNVRLIEQQSYSSAVLSQLAHAVAVHKSSIGAQALYKHKPVVYIAEEGFDNFLIRKKLAKLASTPEAAVRAMTAAITTSRKPPSLDALGTPANPSLRITNLLTEIISGHNQLQQPSHH